MSNTCGLCNRTYVWPADLKRHLKSKHGTNLLTKTDFPLPVGPEITLVDGWTHGMK
jgi:hypothetical protein